MKKFQSFEELFSVRDQFLDPTSKEVDNSVSPSSEKHIKNKISTTENNPKGLKPIYSASAKSSSLEKVPQRIENQRKVAATPEPQKKDSLKILSKLERLSDIRARYALDNYTIGKTYAFFVEEMILLNNIKYVRLYDSACNYFMVKADTLYTVGDKLMCKVIGIDPNANTEEMLWLALPKEERRIDESMDTEKQEKDEPVIIYSKSPEQWSCIVEGYNYHLYRNAFKCSCCQRNFLPGQGYKVEKLNSEIIFCKECKRLIYPKKGSGWMNIISIPMGNKR